MVREYTPEITFEETPEKPKSKKQQNKVLEIGEHFGSITVLDMNMREGSSFQDGIEIEQNFKFYLLKCDCGKTWEVRADLFLGKRKTQDCGCGRAWSGELKEDVLLRVPATLIARSRAAAKQEGGTLSQWIRNLMQKRIDEIDKNKG